MFCVVTSSRPQLVFGLNLLIDELSNLHLLKIVKVDFSSGTKDGAEFWGLCTERWKELENIFCELKFQTNPKKFLGI